MSGSSARTVQVNVVGNDKLSPALQKMATNTEQSSSRIKAAFGSVFKQLNNTGVLGPFGQAISTASGLVSGLGDKAQTMGEKFAKAGAIGVGVGGLFSAAAQPDIQATNQLKQAVEDAGGDWATYSGQVDKAVKSGEKYGDTAVQTKGALQVLVQGTGSTTEASKLLSTAQDLAAAKHISLTAAATQLVKVYSGNGSKTLAAFGIQTKDLSDSQATLTKATTTASKAAAEKATADRALQEVQDGLAGKTKISAVEHDHLVDAENKAAAASYVNAVAQNDLAKAHQVAASGATKGTQAVDLLQAKIHGQANAAADSFAGKMRAVGAAVEDDAASLGAKYGPALTGISAGMTVLGGAVSGVSALMTKFTGAQEAATGATEGLTTAEEASDAAATANPIGLIIAAVVALGVGIYELVTHWKTVWGAIKTVIGDAVGFVTSHLDLILAVGLGPLGVAIDLLKDHWRQIWSDVQTVISDAWQDVILPVFNAIKTVAIEPLKVDIAVARDVWSAAWAAIGDSVSTAKGVISGAWGAVSGIVRGGINDVIGGINAFIRLLDAIQIHIPSIGVGPIHTPSFDWGGLGIPQIPTLFTGTISAKPGLALLGERGPELALLPGGARVDNAATTAALLSGGQQHGPTIGELHVHNEGSGPMSPTDIGREVAWQMKVA